MPQPYTHQPLSDSSPSNPKRHIPNKPSYAGGLSYIDEEGAYYHSDATRPASAYAYKGDVEMRGLMDDPAEMGREGERRVKFDQYETSPMAYPAPELGKGNLLIFLRIFLQRTENDIS